MTNGSFPGEHPWELAFSNYSNLDPQLLLGASLILSSACDTSWLNSDHKIRTPARHLDMEDKNHLLLHSAGCPHSVILLSHCLQ